MGKPNALGKFLRCLNQARFKNKIDEKLIQFFFNKRLKLSLEWAIFGSVKLDKSVMGTAGFQCNLFNE